MEYRTKDQSSGLRRRVLTIDTRLVLWKLEKESEIGFGVKTREEDNRGSLMELLGTSMAWYKERRIHLLNNNHIPCHIYPNDSDSIPCKAPPNARLVCS